MAVSEVYCVAQLGPANAPELENIIGIANQTQSGFRFNWLPQRPAMSLRRFALPNRSFDLDAAAQVALRRIPRTHPVIFLTDAPYGDPSTGTEPGYYYFATCDLPGDPHVAVVSSYLWKKLPGVRPLQQYVLFMLAATILVQRAGLSFHEETRGCPLDYCDEPRDIDVALRSGCLCTEECEPQLESAVRRGKISHHEAAAAIRLLNRALGVKSCFVAMPFRPTFLKTYREAIKPTLERLGWNVRYADDLIRTRRITDAIVRGLLVSDLVIADVTRRNANVFYEVGFAHAAGRDVVLLSQEGKSPFDIYTERRIRYTRQGAGLRVLSRELARLVGTARST